MTETMAPTHAPIAEPGQLDMTAKWKANEEARMAQLGGGSDPWDTKSELVRLCLSPTTTPTPTHTHPHSHPTDEILSFSGPFIYALSRDAPAKHFLADL